MKKSIVNKWKRRTRRRNIMKCFKKLFKRKHKDIAQMMYDNGLRLHRENKEVLYEGPVANFDEECAVEIIRMYK